MSTDRDRSKDHRTYDVPMWEYVLGELLLRPDGETRRPLAVLLPQLVPDDYLKDHCGIMFRQKSWQKLTGLMQGEDPFVAACAALTYLSCVAGCRFDRRLDSERDRISKAVQQTLSLSFAELEGPNKEPLQDQAIATLCALLDIQKGKEFCSAIWETQEPCLISAVMGGADVKVREKLNPLLAAAAKAGPLPEVQRGKLLTKIFDRQSVISGRALRLLLEDPADWNLRLSSDEWDLLKVLLFRRATQEKVLRFIAERVEAIDSWLAQDVLMVALDDTDVENQIQAFRVLARVGAPGLHLAIALLISARPTAPHQIVGVACLLTGMGEKGEPALNWLLNSLPSLMKAKGNGKCRDFSNMQRVLGKFEGGDFGFLRVLDVLIACRGKEALVDYLRALAAWDGESWTFSDVDELSPAENYTRLLEELNRHLKEPMSLTSEVLEDAILEFLAPSESVERIEASDEYLLALLSWALPRLVSKQAELRADDAPTVERLAASPFPVVRGIASGLLETNPRLVAGRGERHSTKPVVVDWAPDAASSVSALCCNCISAGTTHEWGPVLERLEGLVA